MTLMTQAVMAENLYMRMRVSVEAAKQGVTDNGIDPDDWTRQWRKVWAAAPGWDTKWEEAQAGLVPQGAAMEDTMVMAPTPLGGPVPQPVIDLGQDPDVITDEMIHDQVELMKPFIEVEYNKPEMNPLAIASRQFVEDRANITDRTISTILMAVNELRGEDLVIPPPVEDRDSIWQDPRNKRMAITNQSTPPQGEASAGKRRHTS